MIKRIGAFFNPEQFQGWGKKRKYFEGWYFKVVNASETKAFAIIPGISIDEKRNKQAFIQLLDGRKKTSQYFKFDGKDFAPKSGKLDISIGSNRFRENALELDLPNLKGKLTFAGNIPWPKPIYSPGIMGPYAFVPFMECYHGIVSMDHSIQGELEINGEWIDFTDGRGYIEKDWGRSFPSAYVWMQSNHFQESDISIKASVAKIPWIRNAFVGFIAGVWLKDQLIQFTTYNKTKLQKCRITKDQVELAMENKNYRLEIIAHRDHATELASPILGIMHGRIEESMTSIIDVMLFNKKTNKIMLKGEGKNGGLEVAGNIEEIIT
ncbi:MAG: hypothetical protein KAI99_04420 [Cyclobacteriaceae bacterium]|nr:hypothetical protein [Cyclobacteriaceae bacterium]MCK5467722.1 hypothetical protein [Cyclobacteriaceae bacterium]